MKPTGIIRKIDGLGRVVFPIELRRSLDIEAGDALEISVKGSFIVLRKYESLCIFCGTGKNVIPYQGKHVCKRCIRDLGAL